MHMNGLNFPTKKYVSSRKMKDISTSSRVYKFLKTLEAGTLFTAISVCNELGIPVTNHGSNRVSAFLSYRDNLGLYKVHGVKGRSILYVMVDPSVRFSTRELSQTGYKYKERKGSSITRDGYREAKTIGQFPLDLTPPMLTDAGFLEVKKVIEELDPPAMSKHKPKSHTLVDKLTDLVLKLESGKTLESYRTEELTDELHRRAKLGRL